MNCHLLECFFQIERQNQVYCLIDAGMSCLQLTCTKLNIMPDIKEGSNKETVKTKRRMRLSCNSNIVGVANKRTHPIHLIRDEIDSDQVKSVGFSDYIV